MGPSPACLGSWGAAVVRAGPCSRWPVCASPWPLAVLWSLWNVFFFFPLVVLIALCYRALGSWNVPSRSILHPGTSQVFYTVKFYLNSWVFSLVLFWFSPQCYLGVGNESSCVGLVAVWCWTMTERAALLLSPGSQCLPLPWGWRDGAEGERPGQLGDTAGLLVLQLVGSCVLELGSCSQKHGSTEPRERLVKGSDVQILYARLFIALLSLTDPWG